MRAKPRYLSAKVYRGHLYEMIAMAHVFIAIYEKKARQFPELTEALAERIMIEKGHITHYGKLLQGEYRALLDEKTT